MKKLSDHKAEVLKITRELCKDAMSRGQRSISTVALRHEFEKAGFALVTKKGTAVADGGLRLAVNKALGALKSTGIAKGQWKNEDDFDAWKKARFVQIRAPELLDDVEDLIDDLN